MKTFYEKIEAILAHALTRPRAKPVCTDIDANFLHILYTVDLMPSETSSDTSEMKSIDLDDSAPLNHHSQVLSTSDNNKIITRIQLYKNSYFHKKEHEDDATLVLTIQDQSVKEVIYFKCSEELEEEKNFRTRFIILQQSFVCS